MRHGEDCSVACGRKVVLVVVRREWLHGGACFSWKGRYTATAASPRVGGKGTAGVCPTVLSAETAPLQIGNPVAFRPSKREFAVEVSRARAWGNELHFRNEREGDTEHDEGSL